MNMLRPLILSDTRTEEAPAARPRSMRPRALDLAAIALFLGILGIMSWRLYEHRPLSGPGTADRWALASYRDAVYYPLQAVRDGVNPYDTVRDGDPDRYMQRYPVTDTFPLYSPLILLVFAPFALLPVGASIVAFVAMNVVLFVLLAWLTLRAVGRRPVVASVFGLAALLLASQPGRGTFNSGQVALPLALATLGALQFRDRRGWRSAALVAFTTLKPTFGAPLGLLLAGRRNWRSALGGLALGGILAAAGLLLIFARSGTLSVEQATQILSRNQADFNQDPTVVPQTNKARIDLVSAVEYVIGYRCPGWIAPAVALLILAATAAALARASRAGAEASAISTGGALIMLAMYVCVYHNVYDLPLLVVPLAACATKAHPSWKNMASGWRWLVLALLLVPFVNVSWTDGFRQAAERVGFGWGGNGRALLAYAYRFCCAANGLALAAAWGILVLCAVRRRGGGSHGAVPAELTESAGPADASQPELTFQS